MKRKGGEEKDNEPEREEKAAVADKRFHRAVSTYARSRAQLIKDHPSVLLAVPRLEAKTFDAQGLVGKFGLLMEIHDAEGALRLLDDSPEVTPSQMIQMVQLAVRRNVLEVVGRLCEKSNELIELAVQEAMSYPNVSEFSLIFLVSLWAERTDRTVNESARDLIHRLESSQFIDLVKVGKLAELAERGIESDQDKQEREQREARLQEVPLEFEGDMDNESRAVATLRYSADGHTLLVACLDRAVFFDMRTRKRIREVPLPSERGGYDMYISPDLSTIVRLGCTPDVKKFLVYNMDGKEEAKVVTLPKYSARIAAFSADGQLLAIGTGNKAIQVWRTRDWTCLRVIENAHPGMPAALTFTCDGQRLVSARSLDNPGPVKVWRAPDWNLEREITWKMADEDEDVLLEYSVASLLASPSDPRLVAFANKDEGPIALWDIVEDKLVFRLQDSQDYPQSRLGFSGDGKLLLATTAKMGTWDAFRVSMWNTRTGQQLLSLKSLPFQLESFALSPSGFELASGTSNGRRLDTYNFAGSLSPVSLDEVVVKGLASARASANAWSHFLSRGLYDPRLLLTISAFTGMSLGVDE